MQSAEAGFISREKLYIDTSIAETCSKWKDGYCFSSRLKDIVLYTNSEIIANVKKIKGRYLEMNFDEYINRNDYPTLKWSRDFLEDQPGVYKDKPVSFERYLYPDQSAFE